MSCQLTVTWLLKIKVSIDSDVKIDQREHYGSLVIDSPPIGDLMVRLAYANHTLSRIHLKLM